jgi:hypothetical protein
VFSYAGAGAAGRAGSGVGVGLFGPVWVGFHIALKRYFLFCPIWTGGFQGGANTLDPKKSESLNIRSALFFLHSRPASEFLLGGPVEQVRWCYFKTTATNLREHLSRTIPDPPYSNPLTTVRNRAFHVVCAIFRKRLHCEQAAESVCFADHHCRPCSEKSSLRDAPFANGLL